MRLQNFDFAGWIPCSQPLMFRYFKPAASRNNDFNNLAPSLHANFSYSASSEVAEHEHPMPCRKLCGFSFLAKADEGKVHLKELDRFEGEFRYFVYAESQSATQLKGRLLISHTNQRDPVKKELKLLESLQGLDELSNSLTWQRDRGDQHAELNKTKQKLNTEFNKMKALFHSIEEDIEKPSENYTPVVFEFVLERDGVVVFKDLLSKELKKCYYGTTDLSSYTATPRIYKMAYHFIKQTFHVHTNHATESDSMIGPFNCKRVKHLNKDEDKEAWKVFYEHQKCYLNQTLCMVRRETRVDYVRPEGIALYAKSFLQHMSPRFDNKEYEKRETKLWEVSQEQISHYVKNSTIENNFFLSQKATSGFLWFIPFALLSVSLYELFLDFLCSSTNIAEKRECLIVAPFDEPLNSPTILIFFCVLAILAFRASRAVVLRSVSKLTSLQSKDSLIDKLMIRLHNWLVEGSSKKSTWRSRLHRWLRWQLGRQLLSVLAYYSVYTLVTAVVFSLLFLLLPFHFAFLIAYLAVTTIIYSLLL